MGVLSVPVAKVRFKMAARRDVIAGDLLQDGVSPTFPGGRDGGECEEGPSKGDGYIPG